jgi:DNA-binding NtrC family response regulator
MVSKSPLSSRLATGFGIALLAALPALAQTTPAPSPAVPSAPAAASPATTADQHGATDAQKKPGTATTAKNTHKDALSVVRKHHEQTAQTPAKKGEEPVKTDSAGQRL